MRLAYPTWAADRNAPVSDEEWRYTYNRWCASLEIEPREEMRQSNPCQHMTMDEFLSSKMEQIIPEQEQIRAYADHYGVDLESIMNEVKNIDISLGFERGHDFGR